MRKTSLKVKSRYPKSTFWVILGGLLLTSGVSMGIIIGMNAAGWTAIIRTHVMVFYWIGAALLLTALLQRGMKRTYEAPMQNISTAIKRAATGDFEVHIDTLHEKEKEDYLDLMIEDLNNMFAELSSIETLKTDFISNVSHEIKTPIAVIQNYSRLLRLENLKEEERIEYSKAIDAAATRLNTMTTNILKLNRLENQSIGLKKESFDLSAQLTECLLGFETVWEEKQIEIVPEIEDGIMVVSDQELLSIVWNNLLSNAFKFTEPGGTVSVFLRSNDGLASVSIKDTGCGMSQETSRHIFDKFYQGDTSHVAQGNGLGLALVKRILEMAGGEVQLESTPGEGSTFTVTLKNE